MGRKIQPVEGWNPDEQSHAGYKYNYVFPADEFDYVYVNEWDCIAIILEVVDGMCRVTDRLINRDGRARYAFFSFDDVVKVEK